MKKTLVALATLSAVAAFAQTTDGKPGVQIQGLFSGGYQSNSYKGIRVQGIDQNATGTSQVNFRGLEDLGGGNASYFRIESDISFMNNNANIGIVPAYSNSTVVPAAGGASTSLQRVTTGGVGSWANSELVGGIRGGFGDISFGQMHNMGLLWIQSVAAPLQGTSFGGGYGMILGADPTLAATRWANSVRYITPTVNGVTGSYIQAFKQNSTSGAVAATGVATTTTSLGVGLNNQLGAQEVGLKYANGPLTAAFVANRTSIDTFCSAPTSAAGTNSTFISTASNPCYSATTLATGSAILSGSDNKQTSFAGSYDLGNGFLVSGAYQKTTLGQLQNTTNGDISARSATFYNLMYTTGPHTGFVSTGSTKETAANSSKNGMTGKFVGMGYNYALSKNTALTARYESFTDDGNVLGLTGTTAYTQSTAVTPGNNTRIRSGLGMQINF